MDATTAMIDRASALVRDTLADDLVGLILYGSAVDGGLRPDSDLDLLVLIDHALADEQRNELIDGLLRISGRRAADGPARPVELTVMRRDDVNLVEPIVQLQYGEWLRDDAIAGKLPGPRVDLDAVLLIAMARRTGASLLPGLSVAELLPDVRPRTLRAVMAAVLPDLLADLKGDERNVVLTLARMMCTREDGRFLPKDVAAEQVASSLPGDQARMLRMAAAAYRGEIVDNWLPMEPELRSFVAVATAIIRAD